MKKITALLLVIIISALSLAGCDNPSDTPAGMQLVRGGDDIGYYFYSPEGWIVSSQGNIAASYVSTLDTTSVTLVEAEMPEVTVDEYFERSLGDFTFEVKVTKRDADFKLGNAESAKQYIYEYEYSGFKFRTMQIFATYGERFYVFTFTAQLTERQGGVSYYEHHLNGSLKSITDNVKFVKKSGEPATPEYPEVDGYLLVSNRDLCGFDLYVTKDYAVDYSDGIVSVTRKDGSNVTVSKATRTGVSIKTYWETRKKELAAIVGEVTEIKVNNVDGVTLGNLTTAASYEYTYELGGVKYHVYQVFGVNSFDGYAFTFTAPEAVYADRIAEALDIASRIEF